MPDWIVYSLIATLLVGVCTEVTAAVLLLIVGVRALAAGSRYITGRLRAESSVAAPCTSSDCRGLPTLHHVTDHGLQCAECGHIPTSA
ncbi:hypothetical protein [Streptomyces sp. NPDC001876]|uniref:hypothetical protein n=1 Tax=Streptomyces sp. NPDC001876 TaxID=3154402 RepID=UPI003333236A